jgi:DNA-binding MarR family transcriptional regulator
MSNTVTTLEERGWLTRVRSEEDRRVVLIQTTEEGRKILEETHRRAEERFATLLESLTDAEQETLSSGLSMLRRVFESAFPPRDPHCHP